MSEELTSTVELPFRVRMRHGVRHRNNWVQLVRFAAVGVTGYGINLAVFAFCVHLLAIDYRLSSVIAFVISVSNNFWLNRHWTFAAKADHPLHQGLRFFAVSTLIFAFNYVILVTLVETAGLMKVMAQALAIAAVTPLSFLGQKLWSFRA
jgi:dolichol-phosphate mannosyltransferase